MEAQENFWDVFEVRIVVILLHVVKSTSICLLHAQTEKYCFPAHTKVRPTARNKLVCSWPAPTQHRTHTFRISTPPFGLSKETPKFAQWFVLLLL